jgi:predicted dehydrogenase
MPEFPLRYFPPIVELKKQLEGPLGTPYVVNADLQMAWIPPEGHWAWDPNNGNGLVNENTCHLIDTLCYLLGEPVSLYAEGRSFTSAGDPLEDAAAIIVRFESGAVASLVGGGMSTNAIDTRTWLNVYTEHGQGLVTGIAHMYDTLSWARRADKEAVTGTWENPPRLQIMRYSLRHFVDSIKSGAAPSCGIDDALRTLAVCMAVHESFEKKGPVPISFRS